MTVIREFISDFTKIRRTPVILLHLVLPVVITAVFLVYYNNSDYLKKAQKYGQITG